MSKRKGTSLRRWRDRFRKKFSSTKRKKKKWDEMEAFSNTHVTIGEEECHCCSRNENTNEEEYQLLRSKRKTGNRGMGKQHTGKKGKKKKGSQGGKFREGEIPSHVDLISGREKKKKRVVPEENRNLPEIFKRKKKKISRA